MHRVDVHVGRRIRRLRWLRGLTQKDLGRAIGVVFQQVQKYESGSDRISASRLYAVAQALEVPVSYFFDGLGTESGDEAEDQEQWRDREVMLLLRFYVNMSESSRRQLVSLMRSLQDG